METLLFVLGIAGIAFVLLVGMAVLYAKFYRLVDQGKALIVNSSRKAEPNVTFTGMVVVPIVNRAEIMDISLKTIEIDRRGKEGLICRDNIRADIKVTFFVRVNKTREDVLKVAQSIGCARASDPTTLNEVFAAKFSEALKTVGKRLDFEDLYKERDKFKEQIIDVIGKDLNGYLLEDAAIDFLEQTPITLLDKENILDASGIRKITELTTLQNVLTNDFRQNELKAITKQNVEAREAVLALERQQAEAEIKQQREIQTQKAREEAETYKVQNEERTRAGLAKIKADEELAVNEQNRLRQVGVAEKNRERVLGIESERVQKDRALEAISREREVELQRIEKEKLLEKERKEIADVTRAKIAVEKTVAEEEERIKDVRVVAEAKRVRDATLIAAETEAEENLVKEVRAARAAEEVAKHAANQRLTLAEADLQAADKTAKAKIRAAEGVQAEASAPGLAEARVKEADALATEKQGLAQVRVREADAVAVEKQGMAQVRVKEADASALEKQGLAQASVIKEQGLAQALVIKEQGLAQANVVKEQGLAEAVGAQEKGMAEVRIKDANAAAIQKQGQAEAIALKDKLFAEASAIQERLSAEARGLGEKAVAMKELDGIGRDHEEFRLRLDKEKAVELEAIRVRREVAEAQAKVLAEGLSHAKFNIVGGDGAFFERFVKAVTVGQTVDGAFEHSDTLKAAFQGYLSGKSDLPTDIKDVLMRPGLGSDAQSAALATILARVAAGRTDGLKDHLLALARELTSRGAPAEAEVSTKVEARPHSK